MSADMSSSVTVAYLALQGLCVIHGGLISLWVARSLYRRKIAVSLKVVTLLSCCVLEYGLLCPLRVLLWSVVHKTHPAEWQRIWGWTSHAFALISRNTLCIICITNCIGRISKLKNVFSMPSQTGSRRRRREQLASTLAVGAMAAVTTVTIILDVNAGKRPLYPISVPQGEREEDLDKYLRSETFSTAVALASLIILSLGYSYCAVWAQNFFLKVQPAMNQSKDELTLEIKDLRAEEDAVVERKVLSRLKARECSSVVPLAILEQRRAENLTRRADAGVESTPFCLNQTQPSTLQVPHAEDTLQPSGPTEADDNTNCDFQSRSIQIEWTAACDFDTVSSIEASDIQKPNIQFEWTRSQVDDIESISSVESANETSDVQTPRVQIEIEDPQDEGQICNDLETALSVSQAVLRPPPDQSPHSNAVNTTQWCQEQSIRRCQVVRSLDELLEEPSELVVPSGRAPVVVESLTPFSMWTSRLSSTNTATTSLTCMSPRTSAAMSEWEHTEESSHQPPQVLHQAWCSPTEKAARQSTESVRPTTEPVRPTTESVRPTTESVRPTTESVRLITESVRPTTESIRPETKLIQRRRRPALLRLNMELTHIGEMEAEGQDTTCQATIHTPGVRASSGSHVSHGRRTDSLQVDVRLDGLESVVVSPTDITVSRMKHSFQGRSPYYNPAWAKARFPFINRIRYRCVLYVVLQLLFFLPTCCTQLVLLQQHWASATAALRARLYEAHLLTSVLPSAFWALELLLYLRSRK